MIGGGLAGIAARRVPSGGSRVVLTARGCHVGVHARSRSLAGSPRRLAAAIAVSALLRCPWSDGSVLSSLRQPVFAVHRSASIQDQDDDDDPGRSPSDGSCHRGTSVSWVSKF